MKLRGIVVSSVQDNNYFENCLALQSALKPGCGITLRTDETLYRNPGEELEIDLKGARGGRERRDRRDGAEARFGRQDHPYGDFSGEDRSSEDYL